MPTWKGMPVVRRAAAARALFVAVVAGSMLMATTPAGARTAQTAPPVTTTPVTPPKPGTLPPPDKFSLPLDKGIELVSQKTTATELLKALAPKLAEAKVTTETTQHKMDAVNRRMRRLGDKARATQQKIDLARDNLRATAARAYVHAGTSKLDAAISTLADAKSVVDVGRDMHLIGKYGELEKDEYDTQVEIKEQVDRDLRRTGEEQDKVRKELKKVKDAQAALEERIATSTKLLQEANLGIQLFHAAAKSSSSPILGPSRLTPKQLSDFVIARGYKPRITVPIEELAKYYVEEGARYGVRGDVAWAQSILETAGFHLPDYGQVAGGDNNFAGIGACDSCKHGFTFPDARTGVRVQMQLLRTYVDKDFSKENSPDPLLLPKTLTLGFRGKPQTWWDLWGTWATGALYGERVYALYLQIVDFAAKQPPAKPPDAAPGQTP
jgi:hypothetical protein